jgi:NTP pyrophosphatase (non-canonical NTP hydrolase)
MITRINDFIECAYTNALDHGFHDEKTSFEHQMMLVISEISEAVEADRKGRHANLKSFDSLSLERPFDFCFKSYVKDTLEDELADVCIRLFDMCGCFSIEPYRSDKEVESLYTDWTNEFGGLSFSEQCYHLVNLLTSCSVKDKHDIAVTFGAALSYIYYLCKSLNIDLVRHIELKMRFNASRGYKHGKEY